MAVVLFGYLIVACIDIYDFILFIILFLRFLLNFCFD